jgi:hypothetical protein
LQDEEAVYSADHAYAQSGDAEEADHESAHAGQEAGRQRETHRRGTKLG